MKTETAAQTLGISLRTLFRWMNKGAFRSLRRHPINGRWILSEGEVMKLKKRIENGSPGHKTK